MRPRFALMLITPLLAAGLIGAGCGGGSKQTSTAAPPSSSDAAAILAAVQIGDQTGPTKVGVELAVTLDGTISDPSAAALLGTGPITVSLNGPVDPTKQSADFTFNVKAGKINFPGQLRSVSATERYLGFGGKWYKLDANSLDLSSLPGGDSLQTADPSSGIEALGNPADLLSGAKVVGSEDIDGIATDHVTGTLDPEGITTVLARVAAAQGSSSATVDEDAINQIKQVLKTGTIDLWIGQDDKQVHRFAVDLDLAIPEDARSEALGLTGMRIVLSLQQTPSGPVSVSAPSGALGTEEFQRDLGVFILSNLGNSQTP